MTTETKIDPQARLARLEEITLAHGSHKSIEDGACVMELTAYVAGEPWSKLCIKLNDRWDDERRQALKPFVLRLVGTAADEATERKRAFMCADWAVRECLPMALEAAKIKDWPEKLRALPELVDKKTSERARKVTREARRAAYAYAYADADAADAAAKPIMAKVDASVLALLDRLIRVTEAT